MMQAAGACKGIREGAPGPDLLECGGRSHRFGRAAASLRYLPPTPPLGEHACRYFRHSPSISHAGI